MNVLSLISFTGTVFCASLAIAAFVLKPRSLQWLTFAGGMVLLAGDCALSGLILSAASFEEVAWCQKAKLAAMAFVPGTWLLFSLCYSRGNYREFVARWRLILIVLGVIPVVAVAGFNQELLIAPAAQDPPGAGRFTALGWSGKVVNVALLVGSILILVNLERTFRAAVGIMRWRIKYLIIGVASIFGAKLYTSSQALLYSGIHGVSLQVTSVATFVASLLIIYSFLRTNFAESEIYPSHKVLQHSFTAVLAGAYLACVGILANLVARIGGDPSFPIKAFLLLMAVVGLTVVIFSDRIRQQIRLFISRNFRRPIHDYRKVWSAFTERTGSLISEPQLCREVVKLISDTFELLSVTIWLSHEHDKGLVFGASTSLTEDKAGELASQQRDAGELRRHLKSVGPFDMDTCKERWVEPLRALNPDHFHKGGRRVCVPLVSGGEVLGLITVADRVNGLGFSVEDLDLLKCLGDQVAGSLRSIQLSRTLMQNKELQAFQTMSAFFVHDLKNTASTLSLMLQNLSAHFGEPDFREDCLRGLSRSVGHLNDVIKRLTLLRHELDLKRSETDLNDLASGALCDLEGAKGLNLVKDFRQVPRILVDPEQLRKVVLNLLLNAKEAVNGAGEIRVGTAQENGWVILWVADNGCGMSQEFVRHSLFKPFCTTKKSGLGIGMFHSKAIIDGHRGRIEVESQPGKGTTFRVLLPTKA